MHPHRLAPPVLGTLVFLGAFPAPVAAQNVVTLTSSKDNTLYQLTNGSLSNGAGDGMFSGVTYGGETRRCLLAFDFAGAIPPGSTITAASLQLYVTMTICPAAPMSLHRVLASWGEGTSNATVHGGGGAGGGMGSTATPGDTTWLHRFHPGTLWTTQGGDFAATASATTVVPGFGFQVWSSTPAMVADVQAWVDGTLPNDGWLVLTPETLSDLPRKFATREHTTPAWRPQLTVTFTPPAASFAPFGAGCAGTAGVPSLAAAAGSLPQLGNTFTLALASLPPATPLALVVFGGSNSVNANGLGTYPLPIDLGVLGMPGCLQLVSADLLLLVPAASGQAQWQLPIANAPGLLGLTFHVQALVLDAGVNAFGATMTNGGTGRIGL